VINDNIIEQVTDFKYVGYRISEYKSDLEDKLQTYNKINRAIGRHFGKQGNKERKLTIHKITVKAALKFGSEAWVLKKREEKRLEAAQTKFLRNLLGITKLDKDENHKIKKKTKAEYSNGNKTVPGKVATTRTEMDTNRIPKQALQYKPKGRRNIGRRRKRWRDQFHFEDQGTENTPYPS
jgi:hypothetical protein